MRLLNENSRTQDRGALTRRTSLVLIASTLMASVIETAEAASGDTMTIAVHVSLPPAWLDPSDRTIAMPSSA